MMILKAPQLITGINAYVSVVITDLSEKYNKKHRPWVCGDDLIDYPAH